MRSQQFKIIATPGEQARALNESLAQERKSWGEKPLDMKGMTPAEFARDLNRALTSSKTTSVPDSAYVSLNASTESLGVDSKYKVLKQDVQRILKAHGEVDWDWLAIEHDPKASLDVLKEEIDVFSRYNIKEALTPESREMNGLQPRKPATVRHLFVMSFRGRDNDLLRNAGSDPAAYVEKQLQYLFVENTDIFPQTPPQRNPNESDAKYNLRCSAMEPEFALCTAISMAFKFSKATKKAIESKILEFVKNTASQRVCESFQKVMDGYYKGVFKGHHRFKLELKQAVMERSVALREANRGTTPGDGFELF